MQKKRSKPQPIPHVLRACDRGDIAAIRKFLDEGGSPYIEHEFHVGLMVVAIDKNWPELVELLVKHGYDLNTPLGPLLLRPLHIAARHSHALPVSQLLVNLGAKVDVSNSSGYTPLMLAAGDLELMDFFISQGADVLHQSNMGASAFMTAASAGKLEAMKKLLDLGLSINHRDSRNQTALNWAARRGDQVTVKWLLDHGADASIVDDHRHTALDWAKENGHTEVVRLLEQA